MQNSALRVNRGLGGRRPAGPSLLIFAAILGCGSQASAQPGSPTFVSPKVQPHTVNLNLKNLPAPANPGGPSPAGVRRDGGPISPKPHGATAPDPLAGLQTQALSGQLGTTPTEFSTPSPSFDGLGGGSLPPDTNGAPGPNHYIQAINQTAFAVWDKQGMLLSGPTQFSSLWAAAVPPVPVDDDCLNRGRGDPYVIYDHLADRWVLSQLANKDTNSGDPLMIQCIAVSRGPDPVNDGWFVYTFDLGVSNDYPKLAVWPDGYYLITQEGYDGSNLDATVFDRADMLNGNPANFQRKSFLNGHTIIALPSELEGPLPPGGSPNLYARPVDGTLFGGNDRIEIYEFHVDWAIPANTTFTLAQTLDATDGLAAFSSDLCEGATLNGNCIPQPGTTQVLESSTVWPMGPLHYRNFGDHESLVFNHTVNATGGPNNLAGVRWYELRRNGGAWSIYNQGTFSPPDGQLIHRWMGSAGIDKAGNMAIGFSVSNAGTAGTPSTPANVYPGIRYAGRLATDPPGLMPQGEFVLTTGGGVQPPGSFENRWGDYSAMRVDPVDGCTFWFTTQWIDTGNARKTHIGAFRFPTCNPADLEVTKSAPATVVAGNQLSYTIHVINHGPNGAHDVVVTDTLPAGVTFLSSSISCTGGTVRTCNIGDLASSDSTSFTIQVRVPASFLSALGVATTNITNTVSVDATELDPDTSNNTDSVSTNVIEQADVKVSKICKPDGPAQSGATGFCDLLVANLGVSDAQNVIVTDTLTSNSPFQVTAYSFSAPVDSCLPAVPTAFVTNVVVTCNVGTLAAGVSTTIRVSVTTQNAADVNDIGTVSSSTPDPVTSNNQATGVVTFISSADLSITKTSAPQPVVAGTNLTYTIQASNAGPSSATNVVVTDTLPAQVSVVSVTPTTGTCSGGIPGNPAQPVICTLGTLTASGSATITVVVQVNPSVPDGTILINNGAVSSDTSDPNNNNNVVTATSPVVAQADLAVTKVVDRPTYQGNVTLTYTVGVTNTGASDALGVIVTDTLPDIQQLVFLGDTGGCTKIGPVLTCDLGNMAVGTSKSFNVQIKVNGNRGTLTNTATVASSTTDPNAANNTASQDIVHH